MDKTLVGEFPLSLCRCSFLIREFWALLKAVSLVDMVKAYELTGFAVGVGELPGALPNVRVRGLRPKAPIPILTVLVLP